MSSQQTLLTDTDSTTMIDSLHNVQVRGIETKADTQTAANLTKNYCAYPVRALDLQKYINSDRWTYTEFLTDIVRNPKDKQDLGTRQVVAFALLIELNQVRKGRPPEKIIGVRYFAMEPWYEATTVAKWIKFLTSSVMKERKDLVGVSWPVDEYDTPLQNALKEEGFRAVKSFEVSASSLFNTGKDDQITRIIFAL
jgi:hypothetical protein